jgi:biotin carboxylase
MDTCKTAMKVQMTAMNAPTPKYYDLTHVPQNEEEVDAIKAKLAKMRMPVIIKPVYSGEYYL